jgi:hypothetical protein
MQLKIMPKAPIIRAFITDPCARYVITVKPSRITAKNSGAPNLNPKSAMGPAKTISPMIPSVPAINDPKAAIPKAAPALPSLAIWYPSRQVTTVAASPGMFTKIDVIDPPYMEP